MAMPSNRFVEREHLVLGRAPLGLHQIVLVFLDFERKLAFSRQPDVLRRLKFAIWKGK
jgi:hypothetical protein